MGIENIYQLLIYIVPGFLANEVYRSRYPAKKISDVDKIIYSLIYTIFILTVLQLFGYQIPNEQGNILSIIINSMIPILSGIVLGVLLIFGWKIRLKITFLGPSQVSVWGEILEKYKTCWAVVTLSDGNTRYMGWVSLYSFDPNELIQELFLKDVMLVDEHHQLIQNMTGEGMYFKSDNIMSLEIFQ